MVSNKKKLTTQKNNGFYEMKSDQMTIKISKCCKGRHCCQHFVTVNTLKVSFDEIWDAAEIRGLFQAAQIPCPNHFALIVKKYGLPLLSPPPVGPFPGRYVTAPLTKSKTIARQ